MVLENKVMLGIVAITVLYVTFRLFKVANKNNRLYQTEIEKILNSEENKVKGRFEN